MHRVLRWRPSYSPSRSGESGKRRAKAGKCTPCSLSDRRLGLLASGENPTDFPAEVLEWSVEDRAPGIEDESPLRGERVHLGTDGFSHSALHTIAQHGFAESPRRREAEARRSGSIFRPQTKGDKVAAGHADTRLIDFPEVS